MNSQEKPVASLSHIYAPSAAPSPEAELAASQRSGAMWMLLLAIGTFGITCVAEMLTRATLFHGWIGVGFGASALAAFTGVARATRAGFRSRKKGVRAGLREAAYFLANLLMLAIGAFAAFLSTVGFSRGRQLRRHGRVLLPSVVAGRAWSRTKVSVVGPSPIPAGLADQ